MRFIRVVGLIRLKRNENHQLRATINQISLFVFSWILLFPGGFVYADFLDRFELVEHLRKGEFVKLENIIAKQEQLYKSGSIPEDHVEAAYWAFANSAQDLEKYMSLWVKNHNVSHIPFSIRGIYYWNLGWAMRGGLFANQTSSERFEGMERYFELASRDLLKAIQLNPNTAVPYWFLMNMNITSGDGRLLETYFVEALKVDPLSFTVRLEYLFSLRPWWSGLSNKESLIAVRKFLDKYVKGLSVEHRKLKVLEGYPSYLKAEILRRADREEESLDYFRDALKFGKNHHYLRDYGHALFVLKRYEEALEVYSQAIDHRPQVASLHEARGETLYHLHQPDAALKEFEIARKLDSRDPEILKWLGFLLFDAKRYEEADKYFTQALMYGNDDLYIIEKLAELSQLHSKNSIKALSYLKRATELPTSTIRNWMNYGMALWNISDCDELKDFKNGKTLSSESLNGEKPNFRWIDKMMLSVVSVKTCGL